MLKKTIVPYVRQNRVFQSLMVVKPRNALFFGTLMFFELSAKLVQQRELTIRSWGQHPMKWRLKRGDVELWTLLNYDHTGNITMMLRCISASSVTPPRSRLIRDTPNVSNQTCDKGTANRRFGGSAAHLTISSDAWNSTDRQCRIEKCQGAVCSRPKWPDPGTG